MLLLDQFSEINFEEFRSKKLTLPSVPTTFIDVTVNDEFPADGNEGNLQFKPLPFARTDLLKVPLKDVRILADGKDVKKVFELTFDISDVEVDFLPGDTIGIQPRNNDAEVNFLIETLQLSSTADQLCSISIQKNTLKKNAKIPVYFPTSTTCRAILTHYLNIRSIPKKLLIRSLIEYTEAENDKSRLEVLCSKEGATLYNNCVVEKGLRFIDLMKLCPSCKPPLSVLIEHLNRLLPRPYSIANSPLQTSNEIRIMFSMLDDESKKGLTTAMLENICKSFSNNKNDIHTVNMYFRERNNFKYCKEVFDKNLIMIAIGCGVAPFIGFMEHKRKLQNEMKKGDGLRPTTWLFTGSRYRDSVCRREIKDFVADHVIDEHFESFSRESDSSFKYVQDCILANAERFVSLFNSSNTVVYVCADGNQISNRISTNIAECLKLVCKISDEDANEIMKDAKKTAKYIEDIWL